MVELPLPAPGAMLEALAQTLSSQWAELARQRQAVLERGEDGAIHDLRVASRRLRAALELAAPGIGRQRASTLRRPLRELTRQLGQLRDLDEAYGFLSGLHDEGVAPLTARLSRQRCDELRRIRRKLKELPCARLTRKLRRAGQRLLRPDDGHQERVVGWLSERSLVLYRPIHDLLQLADLAERAEDRHRLRIAIKKWRYFSELLAGLGGRQPGQLVTLLKQYQTLLGELNDRELFLETIRDATVLPAAVRQRIELLIDDQHQLLTMQFEQLLKRHPLQYQFSA